jgi:hypothetical protein
MTRVELPDRSIRLRASMSWWCGNRGSHARDRAGRDVVRGPRGHRGASGGRSRGPGRSSRRQRTSRPAGGAAPARRALGLADPPGRHRRIGGRRGRGAGRLVCAAVRYPAGRAVQRRCVPRLRGGATRHGNRCGTADRAVSAAGRTASRRAAMGEPGDRGGLPPGGGGDPAAGRGLRRARLPAPFRARAAPGAGRPGPDADGSGRVLVQPVYVGDIAQAVLAALASGRSPGECFNIVEAQTSPERLFYEQIITAAGASLELVRVPDEALPADLESAGAPSQHLLASPAKAQTVLGWHGAADDHALRRAVAWHLEHPAQRPRQRLLRRRRCPRPCPLSYATKVPVSQLSESGGYDSSDVRPPPPTGHLLAALSARPPAVALVSLAQLARKRRASADLLAGSTV